MSDVLYGEMMKRNCSTPPAGPAASSTPPVSPTVTGISSRSHTPSQPDFHDPPREVPPRPSSLPRSHSPSTLPSTMSGRPGGLSDIDRSATTPQRPSIAPSASAPAGTLPRLLPPDFSQYTDPYLPAAAVTTSTTSLAELAHLIRLQGYQEQRRSHSRVRLHRWLVSSALSARLVHCGELAYRTLVDCFRSDDKKGFATLYNALHDVRNSCDATRRYALLEPDLDFGKSKGAKTDNVQQSFSTFMHEIPTKIRNDLLDFLSELRTNPDFLATRITSLSQQELASLTTFRQALDPIDSVIGLQARGKIAGPASAQRPSQAQSGPSPVERLLSFQRHDPLSGLIYTIFANSSGPDSAEDLRRTDVWATTCARLFMEAKPGSERFIKSVLDAWAGMREWPGKANLELYLMQVLQDGQFLLEKAEDQAVRSRTGHPEVRSAKDTIAADEFYDKAVQRLFEVIDDEPSAGGIPEGTIEIGTAIVRKLDNNKKHYRVAQTFIVSRWFFSTYLLNAIIHPESQGIMTQHHINEHARQKILKEIAIRAQKHVLDATYNWKANIPILPEIRTHIDNIMNRFSIKHAKSHAKPVLLPAKAITSPRETVEVQPFIVISPSDIVTLVNSLFPERRPPSSHFERDSHRSGQASSAASSIFQSRSADSTSILSQSASSMTSDTTSREPLLDSCGQIIDAQTALLGISPPYHLEEEPKIAPTEEYGRRLRAACSEMSRLLGVEASSGSCHPCAERWAVLYVSPDGKELKTRMRKDAEDEEESDEDSPADSDSDDEGPSGMDLESDYHQLKESIAKLVVEYEIPKELAPESDTKAFSNRTTTHRRDAARVRTQGRDKPEIPEILGSKNPFSNQSNLSSMIASQRSGLPIRHRSPQHPRSSSNPNSEYLKEQEKPSVLITMLEAAMHQCQSRSDFVNAYQYYKTLQQLKKISSPTLVRNGYGALLNYFSRGPRDSLGKSASAIEEFEAWFVWLKQSQERHDSTIEEMMLGLKSLRDKMWYITDVRNSAAYEEARNVAIALKIMGQPTRTLEGKPIQTHKPRQQSKSMSNNFLLKTEAQVFDVMAASSDQGGPNKLADEQSDLTERWLSQYSIFNFCQGEERIHRFCLELDKCVNKLVGDGILDGPVLWSSELYRRDKEILDSGRQKGDLFLTGVGTLSIAGDEEYEHEPGSLGFRSLDFAQRPSQSSLRQQQSFESGKWTSGRPVDLMDSQDYFGGSSPVLTIDSTTTFWSPFQSTQSPLSANSVRPRTSSSSKGTVMLKQSASVNDDKRRFLLDLKQTLTGLLLSDLGNLVFGHGSETDAWFSSELGEECFQRKDNEERRRKKALARKKSMKNVKGSKSEQRSGPLDTLGRNERSGPAAPVATLQHAADYHSAGEHSASSSDATARSSGGMSAAKRAGLLEFPYNLAFRRLLRKFATHPNPFSKLHALYELELLIVASLSAKNRHYTGNRRDALPAVPPSPTLGSIPELSSREPTVQHATAQNLGEAIANCEERRSQSLQHGGSAPSSPQMVRASGTRSPSGPPSTDMIIDVLQGLFRDADIRPKSLFRDLQYIASFVPASMLDKSARGKAFWDAGLAALGLKQDVCTAMIGLVSDIVALNIQNRSAAAQQSNNITNGSADGGPSAGTPTVTNSGIPTDDPLAKFTMEDAARMLIITAKEGDPTAERELAIFYLTHPDLVQRTVAPLTRPREIFKSELVSKDRKREDPLRSDPMTMCVAHHWMDLSKKGGDPLAAKYLRQRDEMDRIP